jgi:hypothetical protein
MLENDLNLTRSVNSRRRRPMIDNDLLRHFFTEK